jgi:peptidoglycan/LPS O-acetylase OafA/YrhL
MSDRHSAYLRARYFPSLDGLRGVSIIAVIWHHAGPHSEGILARGALGVELFFAISGLLITTLLLREEARTGRISLRNFYVRRTLRIFPLYYAVIALYVLLVMLLDRSTPAGALFFRNLRYYLSYTSNWFVDLASGNRVIFYFAWSLATEEQFYLFWPSVVRFARNRFAPVLVMTGLLVVGEVVRWATHSDHLGDGQIWVKVLSSIATPICMGCLCAYLLDDRRGFAIAWRLMGQWWSAPAAAALLMLALAVDGVPILLICLAMTYLIAACAIRPDHSLRLLFDNTQLRYVGTISYGMYLLHMLAINLARRVAGPGASNLALLALALPLAVAFATISFRYFERPFLALKDRFTTGAPPRNGAATQVAN